MQTVNEILKSRPEGSNIYVNADQNQVAIHGTPEGFRMLAEILNAQAENLGNGTSSCMTKLDASEEFLQDKGAFQTLGILLHCLDGHHN